MGLKSVRQTILPHKGHYFVEADLSQAEGRYGFMYCCVKHLIELANRRPTVYDMHSANAVLIFGKKILSLSKKKFKKFRSTGKKVVHASWRKMQGATMSANILKDSDGKDYIHPARCSKLIRTFLDATPEIEQNYFKFVENNVYKEGILYNSWGRPYDIRYIPVTQDVLRAAYSFYMQSECADHTNQTMLIPGHEYMMRKYGWPLSMQIHDAVFASLPLEGIYDYIMFMKESAERPHKILGNEIIMPVDFKIGKSYYGGLEYSDIPPKNELEDQIKDFFGGLSDADK